MKQKIIYANPLECAGCKNCEIMCSVTKEGTVDLKKSRIKVVSIGATIDIPLTCLQCANPPCAKACPVNAIKRVDNIVRIDEEKCIGCGVCVENCFMGAILIDNEKNVAIKCDLCGECIKYCPINVLKLISINEISSIKRIKYVKSLFKV